MRKRRRWRRRDWSNCGGEGRIREEKKEERDMD